MSKHREEKEKVLREVFKKQRQSVQRQRRSASCERPFLFSSHSCSSNIPVYFVSTPTLKTRAASSIRIRKKSNDDEKTTYNSLTDSVGLANREMVLAFIYCLFCFWKKKR
jgi:hypothetical protein